MGRDRSASGREGAGGDVEAGVADDRSTGLDVEAYLERIGEDPGDVGSPDLETLERLQRAHVTAVAFENLSIVGDPYGDRDGAGVVLSVPHLYEKVVSRGRGGYCYELNGLFHWLLDELGYEVDRVAARVTGEGLRTPANHHTNVVRLDRRYVVEVGVGAPVMRRPAPLDGTARADEAGVAWRVVASDRPDETYCAQYRTPGDEEWTKRYVFSDVPRDLSYFEATNDYLQRAPESPFTDEPYVTIATEAGYRTLIGETLTETTADGERERTVTGEAWHATLEREFGLRYDRG